MIPFPAHPVLILGASGKLGRALARVWPVTAPRAIRQTRDGAGGTLAWDILNSPAPPLPALGGIIALAGVTKGTPDALAANTGLALAAADLGAALGLRVLVASTQAVYGALQGDVPETAIPQPTSAYGHAKLAMEAAVAAPHVCCLRIGNVAGCGSLAGAMTDPPVKLDRFADGQGPRRAILGSADLAQVLLGAMAAPALPPVMNVARPGLLAMADLLDAVGVDWVWRPAAPGALPELALDVTLQQAICPLPAVDAAAIAAQDWPR